MLTEIDQCLASGAKHHIGETVYCAAELFENLCRHRNLSDVPMLNATCFNAHKPTTETGLCDEGLSYGYKTECPHAMDFSWRSERRCRHDGKMKPIVCA